MYLIIIGHIARLQDEVHQLPLRIDDQIQFQAIEPACGTFAPLSYALKDFVTVKKMVVTDRHLFTVDEVSAIALIKLGK